MIFSKRKKMTVDPQESQLPKKIIIVEDSPLGTEELRAFLEKQAITVVIAADLSSVLYQFNHQKFEAAIISQDFKELAGLMIAQKMRQNESQEKSLVSIIITSGKTSRSAAEEALSKEVGGVEFLAKPFKPVQILGPLTRAFKKRNEAIRLSELESKILDYYRTTKKFDKAIEAVKKQLPQLGEKGLHIMLDLYMEADKHEDGLALTEQLIAKADKPDIKLINTKASLLTKLGRLKEAAESFELADKMAPLNLQRIEEMAELYLEMNLPEESVIKMRQIIENSPEDPEKKFSLLERLTQAGFPEQALKLCKEVANPNEVVRHYNNHGVLKSKEGEFTSAIAQYEQALILINDDKREKPKILFNLAIAYVNSKETGSIEKAIEHLKKCLELASDFEKAKNLLDKLSK